jgi:hypothetical protein
MKIELKYNDGFSGRDYYMVVDGKIVVDMSNVSEEMFRNKCSSYLNDHDILISHDINNVNIIYGGLM